MAMTMRERLAIAALCGWNNVPRDNAAMLAEWQKRCVELGQQPTRQAWERVVDAVLDELETPREPVMNAAMTDAISATTTVNQRTDHLAISLIAWQDMVRAIKDGK